MMLEVQIEVAPVRLWSNRFIQCLFKPSTQTYYVNQHQPREPFHRSSLFRIRIRISMQRLTLIEVYFFQTEKRNKVF